MRAGVSVPEAAFQVETLLDVAPVHQVLHDDDVEVERLLGRGPVLKADGVDADDLAEARVGRRADVVAVLGAERSRHALVLRLVDSLYHEPAAEEEIVRHNIKQKTPRKFPCRQSHLSVRQNYIKFDSKVACMIRVFAEPSLCISVQTLEKLKRNLLQEKAMYVTPSMV